MYMLSRSWVAIRETRRRFKWGFMKEVTNWSGFDKSFTWTDSSSILISGLLCKQNSRSSQLPIFRIRQVTNSESFIDAWVVCFIKQFYTYYHYNIFQWPSQRSLYILLFLVFHIPSIGWTKISAKVNLTCKFEECLAICTFESCLYLYIAYPPWRNMTMHQKQVHFLSAFISVMTALSWQCPSRLPYYMSVVSMLSRIWVALAFGFRIFHDMT